MQKLQKQTFNAICEQHSEGTTITQACQKLDVPNRLFYGYLTDNPGELETFARARNSFAHSIAYQTIDIADTELDPMRANIRIRSRQWLASRFDRDTYGDSVNVSHTHVIDIKGAIDQANARLEQYRTIELVAEEVEPTEQSRTNEEQT